MNQARTTEWLNQEWLDQELKPRRERVKALLIDDDGDDIALFERLARKSKQLDFELIACRTLGAARRALMLNKFDVVYFDYWLGIETSIPFVHEFSRVNNVPAILLTGLDEPDIRRVAFRAGVEAFLSKEELLTQGLEAVTLTVLKHHAAI